MAKNKNPNPNSNPIIQDLLDLKKAGLTIVDGVLEELKQHPEILKEATRLSNLHRYPMKRLEFVQEANTGEQHKAIMNLSQRDKVAALLFENMAKIVRYENNIQISVDDCMRILNISKPTTQKALKTLQENGFIRVALKPAGHRPPIYNLNPELIWVGNPAQRKLAIKEFYKAIGDEKHFAFIEIDKANENETVSTVTIPLDDGKIIRGTEIRYIEKESSDDDDTEDSNTITDGDNVPF